MNQMSLFGESPAPKPKPDPTIFNAAKSEANKNRGMKKAAAANPLLPYAREVAERLIVDKPGGISADDVTAALVAEGYSVHCLGNAAGSLFRFPGTSWTPTGGPKVRSTRVHANGNLLTVWKKKEN